MRIIIENDETPPKEVTVERGASMTDEKKLSENVRGIEEFIRESKVPPGVGTSLHINQIADSVANASIGIERIRELKAEAANDRAIVAEQNEAVAKDKLADANRRLDRIEAIVEDALRGIAPKLDAIKAAVLSATPDPDDNKDKGACIDSQYPDGRTLAGTG